MGILLDTNVLIAAARRDAAVVGWLDSQDQQQLHLCCIVLGELWRGLCRGNRSRADSWLETTLLPAFDGRILVFDEQAAAAWGRLMADGEAMGDRPPADDAKIAATAKVKRLALATLNTRDYRRFGLDLIEPRLS